MCAYAEENKQPKVEDIEGILPDLMIDDPSVTAPAEIDKAIVKLNQVATKDSNQLLERLVMAVEDLNKNISLLAKK